MRTRILSGLILLPFLAVVILGGIVLAAAWLIVAVLAVREFYNGFKRHKIFPCYWIGYISAFALFLIYFIEADTNIFMLWFFAVVIASLIYLFPMDERQLADGMSTIVGSFYVVFFSYHIVLIDETNYAYLIWLVLLTAFGTDVMAYFSGFLFGKHKLCPKISPKKTVEGAIGGTLGSVILCTVFGFIIHKEFILDYTIIGFAGSVLAQLGDLTASVFKRKMGIKDYGNLIPGHGGILDRFDSVLFTAPFVYYYIVMVI